MKKADPEGYEVWRLEQMINFGEAGEKLPEMQVRKYWHLLKDRIDPSVKEYLEFLLWPERSKYLQTSKRNF